MDYGSGFYNIKIPTGSANVTLNISIIDDLVLEGNEEFYLIIDQSSSFSGVIIGNPNKVVVKIIDDDCKCITCIM